MTIMTPITPEQARDRMQEIIATKDEEVGHQEADWLMCEILESLGYGEMVSQFNKMTKWYA